MPPHVLIIIYSCSIFMQSAGLLSYINNVNYFFAAGSMFIAFLPPALLLVSNLIGRFHSRHNFGVYGFLRRTVNNHDTLM